MLILLTNVYKQIQNCLIKKIERHVYIIRDTLCMYKEEYGYKRVLISAVVWFLEHDKIGTAFYRDTFSSDSNIKNLNIVRYFRENICLLEELHVLNKKERD